MDVAEEIIFTPQTTPVLQMTLNKPPPKCACNGDGMSENLTCPAKEIMRCLRSKPTKMISEQTATDE